MVQCYSVKVMEDGRLFISSERSCSKWRHAELLAYAVSLPQQQTPLWHEQWCMKHQSRGNEHVHFSQQPGCERENAASMEGPHRARDTQLRNLQQPRQRLNGNRLKRHIVMPYPTRV